MQPLTLVKEADEQETAIEEPKSALTPEVIVKIPDKKQEGVSTEELEDEQETGEEVKET